MADLSTLPTLAQQGDLSILIPPSLLKDVRILFASGLRQKLPQLQAAFAAKDWQTLSNLVFLLYGAVGYCGLPRIQKSLTDVNRLLQNKGFVSLELFEQLNQDITATLQSLITTSSL